MYKSMKYIPLEGMNKDILIQDVYGHSQKWVNGGNFSFINNPRRNSGFMYILSKRVDITMKSGVQTSFFHGNLIYIPQYSEYFIEFWETMGEYSDLQINFILCDLSGETYSLSDRITCVLNEVPSEIAQIFYQTCDLTNNMKNAYFQVMEQLYKLMGTLVEYQFMRQASLQPQRSISPALHYMDTHIRENTSIPALAHMCMMSESGFRSAFKKQIGISATQYKMQLKIQRAKYLLDNRPELAIVEIAELLGFCDAAYFSKAFSEAVGMPPGKYRKDKEATHQMERP